MCPAAWTLTHADSGYTNRATVDVPQTYRVNNITMPGCKRWHGEPDALSLPPLSVTTSAKVTKLVNAG
jgi:hypothetical protein